MATKKPTVGNLVWSSKHRTYFRGAKKLTPAEMSALIDVIASNAAQRVDELTRKLVAGRLNAAAWHQGMLEAVKHGHRAMAMLAFGGPQQMTAQVWGQVGALTAQQNKYLNRFFNVVDTQALPPTDGLAARAKMYMDALYGTYENMVLERERMAGATQARRILAGDAADDRNCKECIALARKGWMPIGKVKRLGTTQCLSRCRCRIETQ